MTTYNVNIADMIYILDIQKKNARVDEVMASYGMDTTSLNDVKTALERGDWKVKKTDRGSYVGRGIEDTGRHPEERKRKRVLLQRA